MIKVYLQLLLTSFCLYLCSIGTSHAQAPGNITLSVNMSNYVGTFSTVKVNGGFNSWGPAYSLSDPDLDNIWTATVPFPGGFSDYRYEVDPPFAAENMTGACASFGNRGLNVNGDATVPTVYWNLCGAPITMSVDMKNYPGTFSSVKVNGGFNNWGAPYSLTNTGGTIWTATVPMPVGTQDYRFEADPPFSAENIVGSCGAGGNRVLTVTDAATLPTVCWNSCSACKAAITLQVDMSQYVGSFSTVSVNGGFNSWGPAVSLTDPDLDNIWTAVVQMPYGNQDYRFEVDPPFAAESVSGGCASGGVRQINVTGTATVPVVCWNSCSACPGAASGNVTLSVDMSQYGGSFTSVAVNGPFNSWGPAVSLTNTGGNIWSAVVPMAGGTNEYRFEVGPTFDAENVTGGCAAFGNRSISVNGNATIPTVCWNSCSGCPLVGGNIDLSLDMRSYMGNFTTVKVNGNFNNWGPAISLNDPNADNIWTATVYMPAGNYDYRYEIGAPFQAENLSGPCAAGTNRAISVNGNATLPTVCWNSCSACAPTTPVTFRVDLSNQTVSGNGVHIAGNFNGSSFTPLPMTSMGGGIYTKTLNLYQNSTFEFKFLNGNVMGDAESVPQTCGTTDGSGGYNRTVQVGITAKTLPTVCFGSCIGCSDVSDWKGITPNFGDAVNWTAGIVPSGCSSNIRITGTGLSPVVSSGTFSAGSMSFANNASLEIGSGASLDVCGDVTGGGSVTGSGTVVLNGTAAQVVSGTASFQNVTITKPASSGNVTVNGTARIKGILTLANSNSNLIVSPGANLILVSDASGTASIATIPSGASVIGNVTQQRYIPGTGDGWFFIGTSVQGGDFSQWSDNILMYAGTNLGGNQGVTALGIQHSTIFTYNDAFHHITSDTAQKRGWRVPVLGDLINPGQGFRVWLNSDNCPNRTYDNVGSITQGNFNFPTLNRTEPTNCQPNISPNTVACDESFRGWNFLANPYPSAINWDAAGWTKPASMANSFYRWNSAGSGYGVYNGGGSYLGAGPAPLNPNLIPSGQGFFVKLEDPGVYTGTLSITENVKVGNSASFLRTSSSDNTLNILLENPALNGTYNYTGEIRFSESAIDGRDKQVDVANLPCGRFHFGMAVSGQELVLNTMGPLNNVKIVPMNTHFMGSNGTYRFVLSGIESFTAGTTIFIRDNYLGTVQDIVANPIYSFVVDTENQGMVNRFELVFSPDGVSGVKTGIAGKVISLYPNPASGKQINLVIKGDIQGEGSVLMTDVLGKVVYRSAIEIESGSSMKVIDTDLAAGIYTVKVQTASGVFTEKLIVR